MALLCQSWVCIQNIQFFGGAQITVKEITSHVESPWVLFLIADNSGANELDVITVCAKCVPTELCWKSCLNLFSARVLWNMVIAILVW